MIQIPANQQMTVKLEAQHWNSVMVFLGKQPYESVAMLIQAIQEQITQQAQQEQALPANGLDHARAERPLDAAA